MNKKKVIKSNKTSIKKPISKKSSNSYKNNSLIKFWKFLNQDTWPSTLVFLVLILILIKFIFFPVLSLITGTQLPLVIVESCSMYHNGEKGFETILKNDIYQNNGIYSKETINWPFQRGLNKGDIIFVVGPKDLEKGDVIIFNGGESHPIIHRLIDDLKPYATKGDNYITNHAQLASEKRISEDQLMGKAVFRIPLLGWIKLIFFEPFREDRGFC